MRSDGTFGTKLIEMTIIPESDLYRLIMKSQLDSAEKFQDWVCEEVLPTIRKTGGYVSNDDLFINTYLSHTDEQTKSMFRSTLGVVNNLNKKILKDKPKVLFAESVQHSDSMIMIGDLAKLIKQNGIKIGQHRLFQWLRDNNFLIKKGNSMNMPTQYSMERELFKVREHTALDQEGRIHIIRTIMTTGKGQVYFVNRFLNPDCVI